MQVDDAQPSPRRRVIRPARKVASSIGLGLEHTFEKVSMTPPARLPIDQTESPFVRLPHVVEFPATEVKRQALPRSQAFGPFAPLHGAKSFLYSDDGDASQTRPNHKALLQRTVALQNHVRRASLSASSDEIEADLKKASDGGRLHVGLPASPSSFSLASTSISASEGVKFADTTNSHPRRRRTATTPARAQARPHRKLHGDHLVSGDSSPDSNLDRSGFAFGADEDYSDNENGSADSESDDINTLRPGASFSRRRMSGVHGISKSHHRQQTAPAPVSTLTFGGEPMARANTTSSICECGCGSTCHSASITASSSKFEDSLHVRHLGKNEDSPFKTPNKRRARMQGSSSSLPRRNYSTASPIAPPADSEEGTLFGSSSSSSVNREGGDALDSTPLRASNVKRRSVGSLSHWQDISQYQHQPLSSVKKSLSALSSIPRASRSTLPRLSSEAEYTHDSPSHFAFDDSGVALQSPAAYNTPLDKRNDVSFAKGPVRASLRGSEEISASPSKLAASRRQLLDMQPTKISNKLSNGVHERSSLSNETRFSDECSSVNTTPDVRRKFSTAASVPEQLVSPQETKNRSRSSQSSSSLAVECETAPYLTPQTYKNVVPLQAAFMSTGLASKRSRPTFGNVDSLTGEPLPPLPAKLNYGNMGSKHSFHSSGNIAASLGLRDVVAAANAHAAAAANTSTPSAMPDTPMKRPIASFGGSALKGVPTRSRFKATLSPGSNDGNDSSSGGSMYGADSPLLNQDCGSPTLGLSSMDADRFRSPAAMLDAGSWKSSESSAVQPSSEHNGTMQSAPSPKIVQSPSKVLQRQRSFVRQSLPNQARGTDDSLRAQVMRPMSLHRPPLGLQRKSSFGPAADQANPLSAHSPLFDVIPSTPTRHSSTIKWYEAAQLVSTPSPSHRHHGSDSSRRESWQTIGSIRGRPQRNDSANSTSMLVPAAPVRPYNGERPAYFETRFTVQGTLGKGVFSQVDKVEDKADGLLYAVKRMKKAYQGTRDRIRRLEEVDILRSLGKDGDHPNILTFVDAWEESRHLFIQTELCPCVDFSSFLQHFSNMGGSLDEARLWKVMCELKNGLGYIHDANILHLDLKPANIFITEIATLKIGDFGMATRWPPVDSKVVMAGASLGDDHQYELNKDLSSLPPASRSKSLEREGDREYIAPEIIHRGEYSSAADVFSLGLVMLEAACNVVLPDNGEPWQKLRNDDFSDVDLSQFTPSLVRLICSCLASDPSKRPTVATLDEHPVLQAVSKRVAMGVEMSELDQLPIFDFPNSESNKSLTKKPIIKCSTIEQVEDGQGSADTEMTMEGQDEEMVPCTPKPFSMPSMADDTRLRSNLAADSSGDGQAGFVPMERTGSGRSALGLEGVEEHEKVLDVRGALIYENLDFLISVLEAERGSSWEPTVNLVLPSAVDLSTEEEYSHGGDHSVPSISIHGEEDGDGGAFVSGGHIVRAPICASPLRRFAPDCDTDMDD